MLFLVRHGERADYAGPEEQELIKMPWDVHLTKVGHEQALQTGEMMAKKIQELIDEEKIDPEPRITLISSPYYRCLSTSKMILKGLQREIRDNTFFVETAIEEYQNEVCNALDPTTTHKIHYKNQDQNPEFVEEIFEDPKREQKFESLFDYEANPTLVPEWNENYPKAFSRFRLTYDLLGQFYYPQAEGDAEEQMEETAKLQLDPKKDICILVSHGISVQVTTKFMFGGQINPEYCSCNLFQIQNAKDDDGHYKVDAVMLDQYGY